MYTITRFKRSDILFLLHYWNLKGNCYEIRNQSEFFFYLNLPTLRRFVSGLAVCIFVWIFHRLYVKQVSCLTHSIVHIDTWCWNWHLWIQNGLSVVQCRLEHVIGIAFLIQFLWHETNVLDNWQLAVLPPSEGAEFDPRSAHDNLPVPLWVYMRFSVPEHQN